MSGMRVRIMPVRGCSHADAATKGMHPPLRQAQSEAMHAWSTTHARTLTGGRCPALFARRRLATDNARATDDRRHFARNIHTLGAFDVIGACC